MLVSGILGLLSLCSVHAVQKTQIPYQSDYAGPFSLVAVDGAHCLDNKDGMLLNGQPTQLWECSGGPNQLWRLRESKVGLPDTRVVKIALDGTDMCLDYELPADRE